MDVRQRMLSELEVILEKVGRARQSGADELIEDAHQLLLQLHSAVSEETRDPLRCLLHDFKACRLDLDRAELLYKSGFEPSVLSTALEMSMRRVYQLLRLARLPAEIKAQVRVAGLSERHLRPLLKDLGPKQCTATFLESLKTARKMTRSNSRG